MKILVETTGEFQLVDPFTAELIPSHRPGVVTATQFVEGRCARGEVKVLAQLQDNATDEEFVNYWKESPEIAVDAFKSEFAPEAVTKAEDDDEADQRPKPKARRTVMDFARH